MNFWCNPPHVSLAWNTCECPLAWRQAHLFLKQSLVVASHRCRLSYTLTFNICRTCQWKHLVKHDTVITLGFHIEIPLDLCYFIYANSLNIYLYFCYIYTQFFSHKMDICEVLENLKYMPCNFKRLCAKT